MEKSKLIIDAPLTAIIPLWARAMESNSLSPLYTDTRASTLWEEESYLNRHRTIIEESDSITKKFTQIEIAIRTQIIDEIVKDKVIISNEAIFLNIGCGLCTRADRLGLNGRFHQSDSTAGLAFRNKIMGFATKGESQFKIDLNNPIPIGYIREKTGNKPLNIICEGTLMYFKPEKAYQILGNLAELAGANGSVTLEILGSKGQGMTHPMVKRINPKLSYKWGLPSAKPLVEHGFEVLSTHDVWKGYEKKWGPLSHLVKWWPGGRYSLGSFLVHLKGRAMV